MNKKELRIFAFGLALTYGIAFLLVHSTLGVRVDRVIQDQITDTHTRSEVAIVGIDDASLHMIGAWPWKRDTFAQMLDVLYTKGARLVVFDVLFLEPREGDETLEAVLSKHAKETIFASKFSKEQQSIESVYSTQEFAKSGVAHVYPDDDGKVRSIPLSQKDAVGKCHQSLSYQAFISYSKEEPSTSCDTSSMMFLYPEILPKPLSFIDVMNGTIPDASVRDKVIFVGSNSLDIEDHFIGRHGEKIAGVYVHASIFSTLLNNSFLQTLPLIVISVLVLLLLVASLLIALRIKNPLIQGVLAVCGAGGIITLTLFLASLHYVVSLSLLMFPYVLVSLYAIMYRYTITEKKNDYIKELFGHYVHPKVLANILKDNHLKLGGEKKYITILFSDIRGFTTLTEKMPPEKLVETLNAYLESMSPLIMEKEGVIDKYIGDAIMAFWNAPVDVKHHEEKAVRASLHMIKTLKELNAMSDTSLEIGIGLHAGDAIVGNIGSRTRINYTIIGDAVNACSRLEGLTKKYGLQIIVSEHIKNAITASDIVWRSIDTVRVKGKTEVMKLYEPQEATEANKALCKVSEQAFMAYSRGDFKEARDLYAKQNDTYSAIMCTRIEAFLNNTPKNWNGTWDWDEK